MRVYFIVFLFLLYVHGETPKKKHGEYSSGYIKAAWRAITNRWYSDTGPKKCRVASKDSMDNLRKNIKINAHYLDYDINGKYDVITVNCMVLESIKKLDHNEVNQELYTISEIFGVGKKIKFIINGYGGEMENTPNKQLVSAYLNPNLKESYLYVVFTVDYSYYAKRPCYKYALKSMPAIADCFNRFIEYSLRIQETLKLDQFHIIGFDIGAHIAGFMGYLVRKGKYTGKLKGEGIKYTRITGLDAAGPLMSRFRTLQPTDAHIVDVLHTNAGFHGKLRRMGTVDFYANNGTLQPGCKITNFTCSHLRAVKYFINSIHYGPEPATGYWAAKCTNFLKFYCGNSKTKATALFGEFVTPGISGTYYFRTAENGNAIGHNGIQYRESKKISTLRSTWKKLNFLGKRKPQ